MKKLLYYVAIVAAFIVVLLAGTFLCALLNTEGTFPMLIIAVTSFGAARMTATLLKDKLNPTPPEPK